MPMPSVEPMPRAPSECLLLDPLEAQDASYLAASASTASLLCKSIQDRVYWNGASDAERIFPTRSPRCPSGARHLVVVERAIAVRLSVVAGQLFQRIRRRRLELISRQVDDVRVFGLVVIERSPRYRVILLADSQHPAGAYDAEQNLVGLLVEHYVFDFADALAGAVFHRRADYFGCADRGRVSGIGRHGLSPQKTRPR